MTSRLLLFTTAASLAAGALNAQQQQPAYYQTTACIKVTPGKFTEYRQFVNDTSKKMAEARAKAGEIRIVGVLAQHHARWRKSALRLFDFHYL